MILYALTPTDTEVFTIPEQQSISLVVSTPIDTEVFTIPEQQTIPLVLEGKTAIFYRGFGNTLFGTFAFGAGVRVDQAYIASLPAPIGFGHTKFGSYSFGRGQTSTYITSNNRLAQTLGAP